MIGASMPHSIYVAFKGVFTFAAGTDIYVTKPAKLSTPFISTNLEGRSYHPALDVDVRTDQRHNSLLHDLFLGRW